MKALALVLALAALAGLLIGCGGESGATKRPTGQPEGYVRVTRVIDGDSVIATRLGETRLIGVNTPERKRCYADEATEFTRQRLLNRRVGYELDKDRKDRYRRTLAYLYRDGMHNLALVENGLAKALTIYPTISTPPFSSRPKERPSSVERGCGAASVSDRGAPPWKRDSCGGGSVPRLGSERASVRQGCAARGVRGAGKPQRNDVSTG